MKDSHRILLVITLVLAGAAALLAQRGGPQQNRDVVPAGSRVQYKTFQSGLLDRELRYGLYLPPSYETSNKTYPILYFLHGLNENEMRWSTRGETDLKLDAMIADGKIGEFIVAIPFGATGFYTNVRSGGEPWEDVIVKEFIPMIESTYRVNATRGTRGISGISMGGYGSLKLALKYPQLFGSVSAHSAAILADFSTANVSGRRLQMFTALFDRIWGISQDLTYWNANNPLTLAQDPARLQGMKIYFDCGTEDDYGFYDGHKILDDLLTKASYPHEAHLYAGDHGWEYARQHTPQSLLFHWNAFNGK